jgi:hypothetical protein
MRLSMHKSLFLVLGLAASLSGCASWFEPPKQTVAVQTFDGQQALTGAACELVNDRGQWTLTTPGQVDVITSARDLVITCRHNDTNGQASAISRTALGYLTQPINGIIMPIDAVSTLQQQTVGIAQTYPASVNVIMNQDILVTTVQ